MPSSEQVLRLGVVHRDHRELEHAVLRHGLEPDHARRRLLRRAHDPRHQRLALARRQRLHPPPHRGREVVQPVERDHVQRAHQVRPVVHRDVGPMGERGTDVLVVGVVVLALDREHLDPMVLHEMGGDVILRGQRVRGAQRHVRPPRLERDREVRRLGRHVEAGREPLPGERALAREALPNLPQHRHGALGPIGAAAPFVREREILDVGGDVLSGGRHAVAFAAWKCRERCTASRRSSTRFTRSQVKHSTSLVTSGSTKRRRSGARPKWPYAAVQR